MVCKLSSLLSSPARHYPFWQPSLPSFPKPLWLAWAGMKIGKGGVPAVGGLRSAQKVRGQSGICPGVSRSPSGCLPCVQSAPHPRYPQEEFPESGRSELSAWDLFCAQDLLYPILHIACRSLATPLSMPSSEDRAVKSLGERHIGSWGHCGDHEPSLRLWGKMWKKRDSDLVVVPWEMFTRSQSCPLFITEYRHSPHHTPSWF